MDESAELNQYLYDLQGYLVIEDVLTKAQVDELSKRQTMLLDQPAGAGWFFPSLFEEEAQQAAAD